MIEINRAIEEALLNLYPNKLGHYSEYGAIGCEDYEFTLIYGEKENFGKIYLAHKSEFEYQGGWVRIKGDNNGEN